MSSGMFIGFALNVGLAVVMLISDFDCEKLLCEELRLSALVVCILLGGDLIGVVNEDGDTCFAT